MDKGQGPVCQDVWDGAAAASCHPGRGCQLSLSTCLRVAFNTKEATSSLARTNKCARSYIRTVRLAVAECFLRAQSSRLRHIVSCTMALACPTVLLKCKWGETPQRLAVKTPGLSKRSRRGSPQQLMVSFACQKSCLAPFLPYQLKSGGQS